MSRLDAALAYAARGWAVLPLRGKLPRIRKAAGGRGVYDATTDPDQIRQWWAKWPDANIGIACGEASGFWCLDIDPRHGGDLSLENLQEDYGPLPETVEQETGAGGRHLLFKFNGQVVGNKVAFAPGLDTRSTGGYIVAEPSLHPDTKRAYAWEVDHHPDDLAIVEAPTWLIEHLGQVKDLSAPPSDPYLAYGHAVAGPENEPRAALQQACEAVATAPIGEQETTVNSSALCMARFVAAGQLKFEDVTAALVSAGMKMANKQGREPWTRHNLEAKVMHGLSDGLVDAGVNEDTPMSDGVATLKKSDRPLPPSIADYPASRWDGLDAEPPEFVIDGLAPRRRLVNVAGVGGAGKGILMQLAATCVAAGLPFLGKDTLQGPVAYYSCEDEDAVLHHRQARINTLLGLETTPAGLFIKSYLGHNLTMFNGAKWTPLFEWLWNDIDKIEGRVAAVIDPASEVFLGDFLNPVAVKTFCRRLDIEALKRNMTVFLLMHTAKGGDNRTPFGSAQWLYATRATLMLETATNEDGKPDINEATLRVGKGNFVKPGEEIPLLWTDDGLLVRKDEPDAYERLASLKELNKLILRLVAAAWQSAAPLSDNRSIGDRYLPAKVVQASKGKFTRKEVQEQLGELLRLGQLELTQHPKSRRLGLKVTNQKLRNRGEDDT